MSLFGFKFIAAAALSVAAVAGVAMIVQSIKAGERSRIEAALATERERISQEASAHLAAANAKAHASSLRLSQERKEWEAWRQTHAEIESDRCIIAGNAADELRSIGIIEPAEPAGSERTP